MYKVGLLTINPMFLHIFCFHYQTKLLLFIGEQRSPSPSIKSKLSPLDTRKEVKPTENQSDRSKVDAKEAKTNQRPPLDRSERTTSITEDIEDVVSVATDYDKWVNFLLKRSYIRFFLLTPKDLKFSI